MDAVEVPLSIDSDNPLEMEAALKVYRGKPIINSVTGEDKSLDEVLPLVKEYGAAVIALTIDNDGIPSEVERRVAIAHNIIERAGRVGIPREDIIIDCLALAIAADSTAANTTLESIRRIRDELGVNQTLGASNVSFGLPDRDVFNHAFLVAAIISGVTCPTVNAAKVRPTVLATDLILGRDRYAQRYIRAYRKRQREKQ
jgi:5-methyltetrahydrofolate--homocysteine methyltransferase